MQLEAESDRRAEITLKILSAVDGNKAITQRTLAHELGIALGIANATLKRCIDKGLIKVRQAPARRYAYYLTPTGFAEKSRLTTWYLANSFRFFTLACSECEELFARCEGWGWRKLILAGSGELTELAKLCAQEAEIELVAIVSSGAGRTVSGLPAFANLASVPVGFDAVLVTDMAAPQAAFDSMRQEAAALGLSSERVLAPKLLNISEAPPSDAP